MAVYLGFTQFVSTNRFICKEWIKGQDPYREGFSGAQMFVSPTLVSRGRAEEPSFKLYLLIPKLVEKKRSSYSQGMQHLNFPLKHLAQRVAYLQVNTK